MALHLGCSRREADKIIEKGDVQITLGDEKQQVVVGLLVTEEMQLTINYNGKERKLTLNETIVGQKVMMYKPIFAITSRKDPQQRKTCYDFLPASMKDLKTAGRLDYMSEGLLLLSNDGDFLDKMSHPKHPCSKEYLVGLRHKFRTGDIMNMRRGMYLNDYKLNPMYVFEAIKEQEIYKYLKLEPNFFWYKFTLTEGRNNQIRNISEVLGNKVLRLIRTRHGEYALTQDLFEKKVQVIE
jgi:23S rRNA pseudouridine2605 synthase